MEKKMHASLLQLLLKALRFPLVVLIIGYSLSSLAVIPLLNQKKEWHDLFLQMREIGNVISALGYVLFFYLAIVALCRKCEKSLAIQGNIIFAKLLQVLKKGMKLIFTFIAIYTILTTLELNHQSLYIAHKIIGVLIIGSIAWLALQILATIEIIFQHKHQTLKHAANSRLVHLRYTKIHQIRNVVAFVILTIAIAAALMVFDSVRSIGISILASAGFLTAILGLAAQKTLSSLFIGMQLALAQPFGIDDAVVVENEFGTIEEITLSYIVIRIWDGRRLLLPVNYFIEKPFANWSRNEEGLQGTVKLYVDYTLPMAPLRAQLTKILHESALWDKQEGKITVSDFKEHAVELSIVVSAATPADLRNLLPEIREKMLEFMRDNYPHCFPSMRFNLLTSHGE